MLGHVDVGAGEQDSPVSGPGAGIPDLLAVDTYSSPSRTARVRSDARSEPAPGSLYSWHHTSCPLMMRCRCSSCCSLVPCAIRVGPTMLIDTIRGPLETLNRACSSAKIVLCIGVAPRPPKAFGHEIPAQPPLKSSPCHSRAASWLSRSNLAYSSADAAEEPWPGRPCLALRTRVRGPAAIRGPRPGMRPLRPNRPAPRILLEMAFHLVRRC